VAQTGGHRPQPGLFEALRLQGIVIWALMMRELHTRYGRDNLGFLWLIAEPFIFCLGVVLIWIATRAPHQHGVSIIAFVITGYLPLILWRHIVFKSVHCFRANAHLLYHRQVRMLDLLLARIILELFGTFIAYLIIGFAFWAVGLYEWPRDPGRFLAGWSLMLYFAASLGLILGSLTEMQEWTEKLIGPATYFMLPISGMFFMVDWLPYKLRQYIVLMPTVDAYELIRGGQFGASVHIYYNLPYVLYVCSALTWLGLAMTRRVHRYLVIE
jgi:capsular polysaccharide transport system permease protein